MENVLSLKQRYNSCTSCGICEVICPQKCIHLELNQDAFFTPVLNTNKCIACGLCTKVCFKGVDLSSKSEGKTLEDCTVYSAIHKDKEELNLVSSGGVASEFAKLCFEDGYNVLGAVMDIKRGYSEHIVVKDKNDLNRIKGSKYVQSNIMKAFEKLDKNKKTLIIGLPCQIYGIRKYIQYFQVEDQFVLVDLFCRGTTSINLFQKYKEYLVSYHGLKSIKKVNFRSKVKGWHKFSLVATDEADNTYENTVYDDLFYSFYLKNTCFKESCYSCAFRHDRVFSDIRLGDFWGEKYYDHDEGVSIVAIYSQSGEEIWNKVRERFVVEENEPSELKRSQRFNKFPVPEFRNELLKALSSDEKLEDIHKRFGIDKMGFYREKNN